MRLLPIYMVWQFFVGEVDDSDLCLFVSDLASAYNVDKIRAFKHCIATLSLLNGVSGLSYSGKGKGLVEMVLPVGAENDHIVNVGRNKTGNSGFLYLFWDVSEEAVELLTGSKVGASVHQNFFQEPHSGEEVYQDSAISVLVVVLRGNALGNLVP